MDLTFDDTYGYLLVSFSYKKEDRAIFEKIFRCSNNNIWQKANHKWSIIDFDCVLIKVDWLAACIAVKVVGNEESTTHSLPIRSKKTSKYVATTLLSKR
jgi:hypothetical protein